MMIAGNIEVGKDVLASGGYADIRRGTYLGHLVAVRALKIHLTDDHQKIRKVSTNNTASIVCMWTEWFRSSNFVNKSSFGARYPTHTS